MLKVEEPNSDSIPLTSNRSFKLQFALSFSFLGEEETSLLLKNLCNCDRTAAHNH